ncbi:MAG TPA: cob(I)yrinic acid a,c-diamide adenosyltransferase [Bacilli bacterium]|nr:MAG: Cob(I)yrinic acid a,c-diamide adenosyltransferase [Tenericutes bacterium ADurb.BinA124]HNZ49949.1 cob(I)yrinic acid a,c-diamide adenosyltransferase [Bacilli bacterium]HPN60867.1 cob(I)yrinic acid a,c-diamide adenosyltransferase [Bacilli bacterium]HPX83716.1 cob(I)yrinic acid a,c-diamide adenosyltransferase [Bacilli bacterium]HQC74483.1 cob(I)yrinic acid a,c-diamide adenosyltransferase [Bacilli bacterium]
MNYYTRTGDQMTTSVITKRVYKNHPLVECLGTIDELQSHLMLCTHYVDEKKQDLLKNLAASFFSYSADLIGVGSCRMTEDNVLALEKSVDEISQTLPKQQGFLLPGTTLANAQIHIARTVARRLERTLVTYARKKTIPAVLLKYINRVSDLLYVLARSVE